MNCSYPNKILTKKIFQTWAKQKRFSAEDRLQKGFQLINWNKETFWKCGRLQIKKEKKKNKEEEIDNAEENGAMTEDLHKERRILKAEFIDLTLKEHRI